LEEMPCEDDMESYEYTWAAGSSVEQMAGESVRSVML